MVEQSEHWTEQCEKGKVVNCALCCKHKNVCMIKEKTMLMLLMLPHLLVLGHKVPRLRHLYKPIKSKINQYLNNSPKKINRNYSKNYMILLKLQQITSNNRLERFIYIPSGGDIIKSKIRIVYCQVLMAPIQLKHD